MGTDEPAGQVGPAPLVQGPAQVDRGGAGGREEGEDLVEAAIEGLPVRIVETPEPEDQPVGRGHPDRRGAAHGEPANRARHLLGARQAQPALVVGQGGLVEEDQRPALEPHR